MMIDEYKKVIDDFISNPIDWHKNPNHPIHKHEVMYFGMMAKEILALRKENKTLQKTTDIQHETTISDLKLIGKLQQENKALIADAEMLVQDLEFALEDVGFGGEFLDDIERHIELHKTLIKKINNKTT